MSKETFYFSHDYNARSDEKIKKLIRKHGMAGYGIFWSIVEDLYNNENELQVDYDDIAYDLRVDSGIIKSVICDFGLFIKEKTSFGSASIQRRLEDRSEKSEKARQSVFKRWHKDKDTMPTHDESDTNVLENNTNVSENATNEPKIDTIKERKGYKGKKGERESEKILPPPSLFQIESLIKEKGLTATSASAFFNHYTSVGWKTSGGLPITDWTASLEAWEEREKKNGRPQNLPGGTAGAAYKWKSYDQICLMAQNDPAVWDQFAAVKLPDRPKAIWLHVNDIATNDLTQYMVNDKAV